MQSINKVIIIKVWKPRGYPKWLHFQFACLFPMTTWSTHCTMHGLLHVWTPKGQNHKCVNRFDAQPQLILNLKENVTNISLICLKYSTTLFGTNGIISIYILWYIVSSCSVPMFKFQFHHPKKNIKSENRVRINNYFLMIYASMFHVYRCQMWRFMQCLRVK